MKKSKKKRKILKIILIILAIIFTMIVIYYILNSSDKIYLSRLGVNAKYISNDVEKIGGYFSVKTIPYTTYMDTDGNFKFNLYHENQLLVGLITSTDYYGRKYENEIKIELDKVLQTNLENDYYIISDSSSSDTSKYYKTEPDAEDINVRCWVCMWADYEIEKLGNDIINTINENDKLKITHIDLYIFNTEDKFKDKKIKEDFEKLDGLHYSNIMSINKEDVQLYESVAYYYNNYDKKNAIYGLDKKVK